MLPSQHFWCSLRSVAPVLAFPVLPQHNPTEKCRRRIEQAGLLTAMLIGLSTGRWALGRTALFGRCAVNILGKVLYALAAKTAIAEATAAGDHRRVFGICMTLRFHRWLWACRAQGKACNSCLPKGRGSDGLTVSSNAAERGSEDRSPALTLHGAWKQA